MAFRCLNFPILSPRVLLLTVSVLSVSACNTTQETRPVAPKTQAAFVEGIQRGEDASMTQYGSCLMVAYGHMINITVNDNGVAQIDRGVAEKLCSSERTAYEKDIRNRAVCYGNPRCPNDTVQQVLTHINSKAYKAAKEYADTYNES